MKYAGLLIDPPWRFALRSRVNLLKTPDHHYATMTLDDIRAFPIADMAAPDCVLLLWATAPMLKSALEIMEGWGFAYKSMAAWAKQSKTGASWAFGTGYIFRSAMEPLLLGTRGKPQWLPSRRSVRNLIIAPIRDHSRKPERQYEMMEALVAGPWCEVFSRASRPGWDAIGDEAGKFDEHRSADVANLAARDALPGPDPNRV